MTGVATLILVVMGHTTSHDVQRWSLDYGNAEFDYTEGGVTTVCTGVTSFQFGGNIVNVTAQVCVPDKLFGNGFEP